MSEQYHEKIAYDGKKLPEEPLEKEPTIKEQFDQIFTELDQISTFAQEMRERLQYINEQMTEVTNNQIEDHVEAIQRIEALEQHADEQQAWAKMHPKREVVNL